MQKQHTVVLLQLKADGHELFYARKLRDAASKSRWRFVLVTTEEVRSAPEFKLHLTPRDLADESGIIVVSGGRLSYWRELVRHVRRSGLGPGDVLVSLHADRVLAQLIALSVLTRRRARLRWLVMRTPTRAGQRRGKRAVGLFVKRAMCRALAALTDGGGYFLTDGFGVVGERPGFGMLKPLQDPAPCPAEPAPGGLGGLPQTGGGVLTVGLIGTLTRRKHPDVVLPAVAALPRVRLLLAGKDDGSFAEALAALRSRSDPTDLDSRLVLLDGHLTDSELAAAYEAVDVCVVPQAHDGPSGSVLWAVRHGRPVLLTAESPWMSRVVDELGIGRTFVDGAGLQQAVTETAGELSAYRPKLESACARLDSDSLSRLLG